MHDPAEMINKITELEKNLPNVNRPENLYARSHLLLAETNAKMLYVMIDIAKEIKLLVHSTQKLVDILTTPTLNMVVENENTKQQIEAEPTYQESRIWCEKCSLLVMRNPQSYRLTCNCLSLEEGGDFPDHWVDYDENLAQAELPGPDMDDPKKEDSGQDPSPNDTVEDNEADGLGEFEESTPKATRSGSTAKSGPSAWYTTRRK